MSFNHKHIFSKVILSLWPMLHKQTALLDLTCTHFSRNKLHIYIYIYIITKNYNTRAIRQCRPLTRHLLKVNGKIQVFLYPDGDLDHSQNLMGSNLDQDPSSAFL